MARPETLVPGNCYFSVHFHDNDLLLPMIDTLVYVGQEIDQDEGRLWLFKEPESQPSPDEQEVAPEPPALIGFSDRQLHDIVDFDGLIQRLREVAADHPLKPISPPVSRIGTAGIKMTDMPSTDDLARLEFSFARPKLVHHPSLGFAELRMASHPLSRSAPA